MHTSKTSNKSYIGYTGKTVSERLKKHYQNAIDGINTHFYRAIRKYGIDDFITVILWKGKDKSEALRLEKHFIERFNTLSEGYNMTTGGDGGWCVPIEKYDEWIEHCSMPLEKNGRWSGFTDEEILCAAKDFFDVNGYNIRAFIKYTSTQFGMPKSYSKNRFGGLSFKDAYCKRFNIEVNDLKYNQTKEHRENLSKVNKNKLWYSNDILKQSRQFKINPGDHWYKGRKYDNCN
jgi:predicted GIY-YIG superfamily endonuclease